jgi:hypothetical protein
LRCEPKDVQDDAAHREWSYDAPEAVLSGTTEAIMCEQKRGEEPGHDLMLLAAMQYRAPPRATGTDILRTTART